MKGSQTAKVIGDLKDFLETTIVQVTVSITDQLEEDTPELTGFAESNWVPVIGSQRDIPVGSREAVDFTTQQSAMTLVAASYKLPQLVYISNPVPYINDLNNGTSAKAPRDFVETSIVKAIRSII